jgi:hypothetical protein
MHSNITHKYNPFLNEWHDSIYTYNKNNLNIKIFYKNKIIYTILNSYFYLNKKNNLNKNTLLFKLPIFKNLFYFTKNLNKVFFFNIINNLHEFNLIKKQYIYIIKRKGYLNKWKDKLIKNKILNFINYKTRALVSLKRIFISIPKIKHSNNTINILINVLNKNKYFIKKELNKLKLNIKYKCDLNIYKGKLKKRLSHFNISFKKSICINTKNNSYIDYYKNILKKSLKKKLKYIFLKRNYVANIYINNYKFNFLNLLNLKNIIYNIYNKEINLKIINIKYVFLDNSIFLDSITRKLNDRKKRVLRVLKKGLKLIKIAQLNPNEFKKQLREINLLKIYFKNNMNIIYNIENKYLNILNTIKNIHIVGIRLEAKGRLTRRMTASRSVYKLKHKGSLKNIYSYYYKTPSLLLRGLLKSNIDQFKNNSKNKNGTFGITSVQNTF